MVGAGGIGCELLKTLALSGFEDIHIVSLGNLILRNPSFIRAFCITILLLFCLPFSRVFGEVILCIVVLLGYRRFSTFPCYIR